MSQSNNTSSSNNNTNNNYNNSSSQVRFQQSIGGGGGGAETDDSVTITMTNQQSPTDMDAANSAAMSPFLQVPRRSILLNKRRSSTGSSNTTSKAKSVSYMLAANNFVFISLTLPIVVFLSVAPSFTMPGLCDLKKVIFLYKYKKLLV